MVFVSFTPGVSVLCVSVTLSLMSVVSVSSYGDVSYLLMDIVYMVLTDLPQADITNTDITASPVNCIILYFFTFTSFHYGI